MFFYFFRTSCPHILNSRGYLLYQPPQSRAQKLENHFQRESRQSLILAPTEKWNLNFKRGKEKKGFLSFSFFLFIYIHISLDCRNTILCKCHLGRRKGNLGRKRQGSQRVRSKAQNGKFVGEYLSLKKKYKKEPISASGDD